MCYYYKLFPQQKKSSYAAWFRYFMPYNFTQIIWSRNLETPKSRGNLALYKCSITNVTISIVFSIILPGWYRW